MLGEANLRVLTCGISERDHAWILDTSTIWRSLSLVDRAHARQDGCHKLLPDPAPMVRQAQIDRAILRSDDQRDIGPSRYRCTKQGLMRRGAV